MAIIRQSSSRYEQKRMSTLESGIRAAQRSGISFDQIKQIACRVYREKKQDTEEGYVARLDIDKWDGVVFDRERETVNVPKHVVLPVGTYKQFESKRSQRFSRPVAKIFLDHPERLEQYNMLRDHRFSRFMAIDIVTKAYSEKGENNGPHDELSPKDTYPLDLTTKGWKKVMEEHKALFSKMYDIRIHKGLSHLQAVNSIFKEMDLEYKATAGKSVFAQVDEILEPVGTANKDKYTHNLKVNEINPELKPRYFKHFKQNR